MRTRSAKSHMCILVISVVFGAVLARSAAVAADKLIGVYSARVMSQSMPWIAKEAGLLTKYDLDVQLLYVAAGAPAYAALLAGDSEVTIQGGLGISRAFVQGNRDLAFIGGIKNILTHSILAKPEIRALEPRLVIRTDALQAILDEISPAEPRAKKVKAQELVDARFLDEMEKSGFFDQLWSGKR